MLTFYTGFLNIWTRASLSCQLISQRVGLSTTPAEIYQCKHILKLAGDTHKILIGRMIRVKWKRNLWARGTWSLLSWMQCQKQREEAGSGVSVERLGSSGMSPCWQWVLRRRLIQDMLFQLGPLEIKDSWGGTITENDNDHKERITSRSSKYHLNTLRQNS